MGGMADRDEGTDIDKLLAEVDGMVGGGSAPAARSGSRQPAARADEGAGGFTARVRTAAVAGAVGGGAVWVLFALLPFLRATSGGVGAFLATFVAVLLLRRR
jgi:hypothetical protein